MRHKPIIRKSLPVELQDVVRWQLDRVRLCFALQAVLFIQHEHEGHMDSVLTEHVSELLVELEEYITVLAAASSGETIPF